MSEPLIAAELAAMRARADAATPGPWRASHRNVGCTPDMDEVAGLGLEIEGPPEAWNRGQFARGADAVFIAAAREDVPRLLDEVARLQALASPCDVEVQYSPSLTTVQDEGGPKAP